MLGSVVFALVNSFRCDKHEYGPKFDVNELTVTNDPLKSHRFFRLTKIS